MSGTEDYQVSGDVEMKINIDKLTEKELIDLNHKIIERLKFLQSMRAHAKMLEFSVGEQVTFSPTGRGKVIGVLIKYNRKTVTVLTEDGQKWNVPPHLLEKAETSKQEVSKSGNIIEINRRR